MHRFTLASPLGSERGQTGPAGQRSKVKGQRASVKGEVRVLNVVVVGCIFRCGAVVATPFIAPGLTSQGLCPALPLISSTPTRQRRALGAPARQSRGPHRARLRGGVESPRLVRPSVFLARSARLARYAVAQRVQNSRVWPHNGLRSLIEIEWSTCVAHPTQSRRRSPRRFHAENAEPRRRAETGHHSAAGGCRPPCGRHIDRAAARKHKRLLRILPFVFPCCRPIDAARSAPTGGRCVSFLSA